MDVYLTHCTDLINKRDLELGMEILDVPSGGNPWKSSNQL
jgi:hypothetical protein